MRSNSIQLGVREAKAHFSALLSKVKNGLIVDVTDHGREVARIIPFPAKEVSLSSRLKVLQEKGLVSLSRKKTKKSFKPVRLPKSYDLQALLQADRNSLQRG